MGTLSTSTRTRYKKTRESTTDTSPCLRPLSFPPFPVPSRPTQIDVANAASSPAAKKYAAVQKKIGKMWKALSDVKDIFANVDDPVAATSTFVLPPVATWQEEKDAWCEEDDAEG